ncbi:ParA family protein [Lysinibacillus sp. LZ02]|uniref:ParA family protein n=1 Tax=Lysinibacillus sp. LZ02 TaxID=3420668 RepID=UPI003D368B36
MKTLTFFNNKGGVGKTTLTVNLASYLQTNYNKKVLVLDADPQANSTQLVIHPEKWNELYPEAFGTNNHTTENKTIKSLFQPLLVGDREINPNINFIKGKDHSFGFDLIAGDPSLSQVEDILSSAWEEAKSGSIGGIRTTNWLNILKKHATENEYDFLIIDVGPSLGALNRSILLNSEYILIPMGSDIFSLMGIRNISEWINDWRKKYNNSLKLSELQSRPSDLEKYFINHNIERSTQLIGFSIQQYNSRKFKSGYRPVKAYDEIISKMPETIVETLSNIIPKSLKSDLNLGDVPYLNSIIPIAQSNNAPLYSLNNSHGIRGGQSSNVIRYEEMLDNITSKLLRNIETIEGDHNE